MKKKQKDFISVQHAEEYKAKMERLQSSLKLPLLVSIPSSLVVIFLSKLFLETDSTSFLAYVLAGVITIALAGLAFSWIFAFIKGGKILLSVVAELIFWGFVVFNLPYSIIIGLFVMVFVLLAVLIAPWILLLAVMNKARKEIKRAEEFIRYSSQQAPNY